MWAYLSAQVERIAEPRLLPLFCCQSFDWLQNEVVVQVQIVKISAVDDQVEHIEALPT
jgi:hypothetical protein